MKGCLYKGRSEGGIEIPEGCWWIVFDNNEIYEEGYLDQFSGEELAFLPASIEYALNTYVQNSTDLYSSGLNPARPSPQPQQTSSFPPRGPSPSPSPQHEPVKVEVKYLFLVLAFVCVALIAFLVWRRKQRLNREVDIPFEYDD